MSGIAGIRLSSANSEAERVAISFGVAGKAFLHRLHRVVELAGIDLAAHAALEFRALAGRQARRACFFQAACASCERLPGLAPGIANVGGDFEGGIAPAERLARAGDLFGAKRRAVRVGFAGLGRRAVADGGLAGDQRRLVR